MLDEVALGLHFYIAATFETGHGLRYKLGRLQLVGPGDPDGPTLSDDARARLEAAQHYDMVLPYQDATHHAVVLSGSHTFHDEFEKQPGAWDLAQLLERA